MKRYRLVINSIKLITLFFSLFGYHFSVAQNQTVIYTGRNIDSIFNVIFNSPIEVENEIERLKLISKSYPDSILYKAYRTIGVYYGVTSNYDSSLKYISIAEKFTKPNSFSKVNAKKNIAIVLRKQGKYRDAINLLQTALEIAKAQNLKAGIAGIYTEMAANYDELGNENTSILYMLNSIKILTALNRPNDMDLALAKFDLGISYLNSGKLEFARKLFLEGKKEFKKMNNMSNYYLAAMNLGICRQKQGFVKEAEVLLLEALNGAKSFQDYEIVALINQHLAEIFAGLNEVNKAAIIYKDVLKYCLENKSPNLFYQANCYIGFLNKRGNYNQVLALQKQLIPFESMLRLDEKSDYYKELGFAYLNLGHKDDADKLFKLAFHYKDSFEVIKDNDIVNNSQAIYQSQIQEKEIKILEQDVKVKDQLVTRSILFAISFVLLISVISVYYYYKYKLERKNSDFIQMSLKAEHIEKEALSYAFDKQHLQNRLQDEVLNRQKLALDAKTNFVRNISHEIRTPLHAINGVTNIMLTDKYLQDSHKENINIIKAQSNHLMDLYNSVLNYDQIERGEINYINERFDLKTLVKELGDVYSALAEQKGVEFESTIIPELTDHYLADVAKIKQVLQNLLSNAVKFTDHGKVTLSITRIETELNADAFQFRICDTGRGIHLDNKNLIFQAFEQADMSNLREKHGIGLGLTISNKLVEGLGGILKVDSELNKGSCFYFDLVLRRDKLVEPSQSIASEAHTIQGKKALIVEDIELNALLVKRYLKSVDCEFMHALNGKIALDLLNDNHFDFILMDLQMPVMDGITCTKEIRKSRDETLRNIPIIVISAASEVTIRKEAFTAGVNDFVLKPFEFTVLSKTILNALYSSQEGIEQPKAEYLKSST